MAEQPMTKTEVRQFLKRIREATAWAERALRAGDAESLLAAMQEATGSAVHIEGALLSDDGWASTDPRGVRGMR